MERVELKTCEACGRLWYRPVGEPSSYCGSCERLLSKFAKRELRKPKKRAVLRNGMIHITAASEGEQ